METTGLETLATVISAVFTNISSVVSTIVSKPLLLIPLGLAFSAGVIGLAKSLMGTKRR